jgi:hypothetical protein
VYNILQDGYHYHAPLKSMGIKGTCDGRMGSDIMTGKPYYSYHGSQATPLLMHTQPHLPNHETQAALLALPYRQVPFLNEHCHLASEGVEREPHDVVVAAVQAFDKAARQALNAVAEEGGAGRHVCVGRVRSLAARRIPANHTQMAFFFFLSRPHPPALPKGSLVPR